MRIGGSIDSRIPLRMSKDQQEALCTPLCTLPRNWQEIVQWETPRAKSLD
jgi:hypothetical protein